MKSLITVILLLMLSATSFAAGRDIVAKTRLNHHWSNYFFDKVDTLFGNTDIMTLMKGQNRSLDVETIIDINDFKSKEEKDLFGGIQEFFNYKKLSQVKIVTSVKGISYEFGRSVDVNPKNIKANGIRLEGDAKINGFNFKAKDLIISIMLPNRSGSFSKFIDFSFGEIECDIAEGNILNIGIVLDIAINKAKNKMQFGIHQSNFDSLLSLMDHRVSRKELADKERSKEDVLFDWEYRPSEEVRPFAFVGDRLFVLVGDMENFITNRFNKSAFIGKYYPSVSPADYKNIEVAPIDLKNFSERYDSVLKNYVYRLALDYLAKGGAEKLAKIIEEMELSSDFIIASSVYSLLRVSNFEAKSNKIIDIGIQGEFSTEKEYKYYNPTEPEEGAEPDTRGFFPKNAMKAVRTISEEEVAQSEAEAENLITTEQADMVIMANEHYLTKLVKKLYESGAFDETFTETGIRLNDENRNNIFILLDQEGKNISLYMDVIYDDIKGKAGSLYKTILGVNSLRFPVRFDISAEFVLEKKSSEDGEKVNNKKIPLLKLTINDFEDDANFILKGREDLGLRSSVQDLKRLQKITKKAVVKVVQDSLKLAKGVEIKMEMEPFDNMDMEKATIRSNGKGYAFLQLKLDDSKSEKLSVKDAK